jgi:hypothetical protein
MAGVEEEEEEVMMSLKSRTVASCHEGVTMMIVAARGDGDARVCVVACTYRSTHNIWTFVVRAFWQRQLMDNLLPVTAAEVTCAAAAAATAIAGAQTQQQHTVVVFFGASMN